MIADAGISQSRKHVRFPAKYYCSSVTAETCRKGLPATEEEPANNVNDMSWSGAGHFWVSFFSTAELFSEIQGDLK
jgi:hypothetical protein